MNIIAEWPEESREATQLVLDKYSGPDEATDSLLIWYGVERAAKEGEAKEDRKAA